MKHGIKGYKDCRDSNLLWTVFIEEKLERAEETGQGMLDTGVVICDLGSPGPPHMVMCLYKYSIFA